MVILYAWCPKKWIFRDTESECPNKYEYFVIKGVQISMDISGYRVSK